MLFVSNDKTKFITTTEVGKPCFMRPTHVNLAKQQGLDIYEMADLTADYYFRGKGFSFKEFLNKA